MCVHNSINADHKTSKSKAGIKKHKDKSNQTKPRKLQEAVRDSRYATRKHEYTCISTAYNLYFKTNEESL
jgi:hypothetical protein